MVITSVVYAMTLYNHIGYILYLTEVLHRGKPPRTKNDGYLSRNRDWDISVRELLLRSSLHCKIN